MQRPRAFSSLSSVAYQLSRYFARQARTDFTPVVAYPFAAIITAVVFVESYFNELIELSASRGQLVEARAQELRQASLEDKLGEFLADLSNNQTQWNRGAEPYQSFRQLLTLRNELVHYKPALIPMGQFPDATIEQIARRFPHEWLDRCDWVVAVLTADVADWACQTTRAIVEEFHRLRETPNPWQSGFPGWQDNAWQVR